MLRPNIECAMKNATMHKDKWKMPLKIPIFGISVENGFGAQNVLWPTCGCQSCVAKCPRIATIYDDCFARPTERKREINTELTVLL